MQIIRHKSFKKKYSKLDEFLKAKVNLAIETFFKDPFNLSLKNHALKGSLYGKRAISVTGDIRIIFEEYNNYVLVIMLDVGTHSQVY
jgi:addiction module RelE/StbE family toxin